MSPAKKILCQLFSVPSTRLQFGALLFAVSLTLQVLLVSSVSAQTAVKTPRSAASNKGSAGAAQVPNSKTKLIGSINAFGMACVATGVIPLSTQLPTSVEEVKKGSRAFYAGVLVGDRILEATIEKDLLKLKIERKGHVYLASMQAQLDNRWSLSVNPGNDLSSILRSYQIRLIVDHSGSMYRPLGNSDKLRWTWVTEELDRFCSNVQRQSASHFDMYLFNDKVNISTNQSAFQIRNTLADAVTTGDTNLPAALRAATADSPKPILIILVTDGHAVSSKENGAILAENLSRTAILRRSKIIFLQAGYSPEGASFVASLNDALVARGVGKQAHAVLFEEASNKGILGVIEPFLRY